MEIDAARGGAVTALCVSHSALYLPAHPTAQSLMAALGMVATPAFLLLGGVICGFLGRSAAEDEDAFKRRLLDRGLFLLIVVHFVVAFTNAMWAPIEQTIQRSFYITDIIGTGVIVAAFTVRRLSPQALLSVGLSALVVSNSATLVLEGGDGLAGFLFRLLVVGNGDWTQGGYTLPVLPYLGLYFIGLAGGVAYRGIRTSAVVAAEVARPLALIGLACIALSGLLKLGALGLKPHISSTDYAVLYFLTDPRQKIPPGASYLLAFAGAGALMVSAIFAAAGRDIGRTVLARLAVLGRSSLAVFVFQYFVYALPARVMGLTDLGPYWLVAFPLSIGLLYLAAVAWDRNDCNRFLTLGLRQHRTSPNPGSATNPPAQ